MEMSLQEAPPAWEPVSRVRFGSFEVDGHLGEMYKGGLRLRIQEKPLQALLLLTERPGRLVTRQELIEALWPDDRYGDFEHGLNLVINRLRSALRDRADSPRFVETVPRRGYRFIAPVESVEVPPPVLEGPSPRPERSGGSSRPAAPGADWKRSGFKVLAGALLAWALFDVGNWAFSHSARRLPPAPAGERKVLLVLPFRDLSPEPMEYLSQGLTVELIARVGRLDPEQLGVIAFTTALQYEDTSRNIGEISRELGVSYVVEGSVTHGDNRLRIHVQLIKTADQTLLLSESYDRSMSGILDLADTVAENVSASLKSEVLDLRPSPVREASTHPEAYMAFLRGSFLLDQRTDASLRQSADELARAIAIDPSFAMAYAVQAQSFALFPFYGLARPSEAMPKALEAARRALELDPELAEAHAALALVSWAYEWDFKGARESFRKATTLNANYAPAHQWYADFLMSLGDFDGARQEMRRALELDPLSLIINTRLALIEFYARDFDQAILYCRKVLELQPYFAYAQELLALSYAHNGAYDEAVAGLADLLDEMPTPAFFTTLAQVHALAGDRPHAVEVLGSLLQSAERSGRYVPPYRVALVYSALGDSDEAFRWLEAAFEERAFEMSLLGIDPRLDPLRDDPRFQALQEKVTQRSVALRAADR